MEGVIAVVAARRLVRCAGKNLYTAGHVRWIIHNCIGIKLDAFRSPDGNIFSTPNQDAELPSRLTMQHGLSVSRTVSEVDLV